MPLALLPLRDKKLQIGDFSKDFVEKIARDEPQWMRERRLEAYSLYESLPMPHTTEDDVWRRTVDMRTQDYWAANAAISPWIRSRKLSSRCQNEWRRIG